MKTLNKNQDVSSDNPEFKPTKLTVCTGTQSIKLPHCLSVLFLQEYKIYQELCMRRAYRKIPLISPPSRTPKINK